MTIGSRLRTTFTIGALLSAVSGFTSARAALTLTQFVDCVGPNIYNYEPGSTCTLGPNGSSGTAWPVTSQINVTRSGITIKGSLPAGYSGGTPSGVILKRSANISKIMSVTAHSVTIQDLVFHGSKSVYGLAQTKHDLSFSYPSWNNYVLDSIFMDAPGIAINAQYYTYIQYCDFHDAGYVGVLTFTGSGGVTDVGIYGGSFSDVGTNAVYFQHGATNSIVYDVDFYGNHKTCVWNSPGGQILLDYTTSGIWIQNNWIEGNFAYCGASYPQSSAGIETEGTSHVLTGNTVKEHRWWGIYGTAANNIEISYNTIIYNGLYYADDGYGDGVRLFGKKGLLTCSPSNYTIKNNTISSNYGWGIRATKDGCSAPNTSTVSLSDNTIEYNPYGPTNIPAP